MTGKSETRQAQAAMRPGPVLGLPLAGLIAAALATVVLAAPVHPPLEGEDIAGLNRACGAAVDTTGNVYASSPGDGEIRVYEPDDPAQPLTTIDNANEPCGLAVSSKGSLFVAEGKTGKVVRYEPDAFPLGPSPIYESPLVVDPSGQARGVSMDRGDDRLYVAAGDHVNVYEEDGTSLGQILAGELQDPSGVAAYTYAPGGPNAAHYLFAADTEGAADVVRIFSGPAFNTMKERETITGPEDEVKFELGPAGSALAVDPSSGHFFVYDDKDEAVFEFEASGAPINETEDERFADAEPTALAVRPRQDEVQRLTIEATGGDFTLSFEGETTDPIGVVSTEPSQPKADEAQEKLEMLTGIGAGNVAVHGRYDVSAAKGTYAIAFTGALAETDVTQLVADDEGLTGTSETASVATATQGSGPGRLYVGAGDGPGAELLAFGPWARPSRRPLGSPSSAKVKGLRAAVAVDRYGNRYVANSNFIVVYPPQSDVPLELGSGGKGIDNKGGEDLEVDSEGNVYALNGEGKEAVVYEPDAFPPGAGAQYAAPKTVTTAAEFGVSRLTGIGLNPVNDHLYVASEGKTIEFKSVAEGLQPPVRQLSTGGRDVAVHGATGKIYFGLPGSIAVIDEGGEEVLARIDGSGGPRDTPRDFVGERITVDQANGHVLLAYANRGQAEEYEATGAFVTGFDPLTEFASWGGVAVDNGDLSPNRGDAYVAYNDAAADFELEAFEPLTYGQPPSALTELASGVGGGAARLNGSVDPRRFAVTECYFEYLLETQHEEGGFAGASVAPCAQSAEEIGEGSKPVPVHADISGLDPEARYRFRLLAVNEYGENLGTAEVLGPPRATTLPALPVTFGEAMLHGEADPSGLPAQYSFQYGTEEGVYTEATPAAALDPGGGEVSVQFPLTGLTDATTYYVRLVVEGEAGIDAGAELSFTTRSHHGLPCDNAEYRTGLSASLPDCRAYELVTPAQTAGAPLAAPYYGSLSVGFSSWLTPPRGTGAGEALGFGADSTLPGFDAVGLGEGYRATRAAGAHPAAGWSTAQTSTSYSHATSSLFRGASPDHLYSFWRVSWAPGTEGTLAPGEYLRAPAGFEPTGRGPLGEDLEAEGRYVGSDGSPIIFTSAAELAAGAPPAGAAALYARPAGSAAAEVISTPPGGGSFAAGEDAVFVAAAAGGEAVLFGVDETLYLNREGQTVAVAEKPYAFAGLAEDGGRVFYAAGQGNKPAPLYVCEIAAGPCAGGPPARTEIAAQGIFVNVAAQGSRAFFVSEAALTPVDEENEAGQHAEAGQPNLYAWEGGVTAFVAILDPQDFLGFGDATNVALDNWTEAVAVSRGPGRAPTRSTPGGEALAFQSHAQLTSFENQGKGEVYLYAPAAPPGERLLCASCDPGGAAPAEGARLVTITGGVLDAMFFVPNLSDDGRRLFFESAERLVPGDANGVQDVYEWQARGTGGCVEVGGCLALISSGQGERDSYLYAASADGEDVFFHTLEELVGADLPGTASIYDARVDGGIPEPVAPAPCQGDSCQPPPTPPPALPAPLSAGAGEGADRTSRKKACRKGQRRVKGKGQRRGKGRCVAKKRRQHGKRKAAMRGGRGQR